MISPSTSCINTGAFGAHLRSKPTRPNRGPRLQPTDLWGTLPTTKSSQGLRSVAPWPEHMWEREAREPGSHDPFQGHTPSWPRALPPSPTSGRFCAASQPHRPEDQASNPRTQGKHMQTAADGPALMSSGQSATAGGLPRKAGDSWARGSEVTVPPPESPCLGENGPGVGPSPVPDLDQGGRRLGG